MWLLSNVRHDACAQQTRRCTSTASLDTRKRIDIYQWTHWKSQRQNANSKRETINKRKCAVTKSDRQTDRMPFEWVNGLICHSLLYTLQYDDRPHRRRRHQMNNVFSANTKYYRLFSFIAHQTIITSYANDYVGCLSSSILCFSTIWLIGLELDLW